MSVCDTQRNLFRNGILCKKWISLKDEASLNRDKWRDNIPIKAVNSLVPEELKAAIDCTEDLSKWFCFLPASMGEHIPAFPVTPTLWVQKQRENQLMHHFQRPDIQAFCEEFKDWCFKLAVSSGSSCLCYYSVISLSQTLQKRQCVFMWWSCRGKNVPALEKDRKFFIAGCPRDCAYPP